MPIAGNNVEAIRMQVIAGSLVEGAKQRIPSGMAVGAAEAIALLAAGEVVYVHWFGTNYVDVRAALWAQGVEVSG